MKYILLFALLVWNQVQAQSVYRIFYTKDGEEVQTENVAQYYRDITKINDTTYRVIQYSKTNVLQSEAYVRNILPFVFHGRYVSYYDNQQIESEGFYENGRQKGLWKRYYSNGQLKEEGNYVTRVVKHKEYTNQYQEFIVDTYKDSTGNTLVENGTGDFRTFFENGEVKEIGRYESGEKVGVWKAFRKSRHPLYEEQYTKGILDSGVSYDSLGKAYAYKVIEESAEFKGGVKAMYSFLAKAMRYPVEAQRSRMQGKVFTSFIIDSKGGISDIKVLKSPGNPLSYEAIRVIEYMAGKWEPGKQRGQAVKSRYNLPLSFMLD
ncbi:energy transducer TonB [Siphonobacter sp. SORGH_AS_1065]|uniref:energy transducer TonB n=1 Tax=Siphonobacter sp. SORGH_AS_1065 TaxID=3041795 RepID=UPI002780BB35|nr:energy transducer TonB [Siphonobacter sp. SORGH_AS_1065]MDQ1086102.1 TonB family protein [Siphonobacter sp. SORGH_AS_1065]